jgi:hypothetical protein
MDTMAELVTILLRLAASLTLTASVAYLAYSIWRGTVRPRFVWIYVGVVLAMIAALRWFFLAEGLNLIPEDWESSIADWQPPMNQTLYILLGFGVILLIRAHIVGVRGHYKRAHGHE